jgi:pSer/pThr/pTyr-binding forkhead associated (FHA) protein
MNILYLKEKLGETISKISLDDKDKDYWYVGRNTDNCDLIIPDQKISRIHCTIVRSNAVRRLFNRALTCSANGFLLLDGKFGNPRSTSGIYVNHQRVYRFFLDQTTKIFLGDVPYFLQFIPVENSESEDVTQP